MKTKTIQNFTMATLVLAGSFFSSGLLAENANAGVHQSVNCNAYKTNNYQISYDLEFDEHSPATYKLDQDSAGIHLKAGAKVTVDLNGFIAETSKAVEPSDPSVIYEAPSIRVDAGAQLKLVGAGAINGYFCNAGNTTVDGEIWVGGATNETPATMTFLNTTDLVGRVYNNGDMYIEGGDFAKNQSQVFENSGDLIVNGGSFGNKDQMTGFLNAENLTINGGTFYISDSCPIAANSRDNARIVVTGGEFDNLVGSDQPLFCDKDCTEIVVSGTSLEISGGTYRGFTPEQGTIAKGHHVEPIAPDTVIVKKGIVSDNPSSVEKPDGDKDKSGADTQKPGVDDSTDGAGSNQSTDGAAPGGNKEPGKLPNADTGIVNPETLDLATKSAASFSGLGIASFALFKFFKRRH